jgi:tetratricopeptide (TPR) repeat protein
VEVFGLYPHAHYLATEMVAKAKLPDGRIQPLLHIRQWDFDWQDEYRYAKPFILPKGTTIAFRYVFDNSRANLRNPHSPPRAITYGPNSTNEMAELLLQVSPRAPDDLAVLGRYSAMRAIASEIQLSLKKLEKSPNDPAEHRALARRYLQLGESGEAIRHLNEVVRLEPEQGRNHYLLGDALAEAGQLDEALAAFREAMKLEPEQPQPYDAAARALVLHPNPSVRNPSEALVLSQRAVGLSKRKDLTFLETLLQVHLSLGQVMEAKRVAAEAIELARSTGNAQAAEVLQHQLEQMR